MMMKNGTNLDRKIETKTLNATPFACRNWVKHDTLIKVQCAHFRVAGVRDAPIKNARPPEQTPQASCRTDSSIQITASDFY